MKDLKSMSKKLPRYSGNNQWHEEILTSETREILPFFKKIKELKSFHLVGGTALSLYLGHRESVDLDFFIDKDFSSNITQQFKLLPFAFTPIHLSDNACEFSVNNVKVFLMSFFYPLTDTLFEYETLQVASPIDIALMKILALEGRTSWKDVIDLFFIDREVAPIEDIFKLINEFYFGKNTPNKYSQIKILLDEKELNNSPKPKMLVDVDFEKAKTLVYSKINKLISADLII